MTPPRIIAVQVLAEFPCESCGVPVTRLTRAKLTDTGTVDPSSAEPYPGDTLCRECADLESQRRQRAIVEQRKARRP